jgi:hypothetical protein
MNKTFYLYTSLMIFVGCSSLFQTNMERWQHLFDDQPLVTKVPVPTENQTHFNTRNIVLDGFQTDGNWYFLTLMGTIIVDHNTTDTNAAVLSVFRFRSVGSGTRFTTSRNIQIFLNDKTYNFNALDYDVSKSKGDFTEDWSAGIPRKLLKKVAYSDTVRMMIGNIPVVLNKKMMEPLRVLVDTVQIN